MTGTTPSSLRNESPDLPRPPSLPDTPDAFRFRNASFHYPGQPDSLRGIDFGIAQGESVALCGPNGSGKTTLLKLASGLLTPTRGSVQVGGKSLDRSARKSIFRRVGFLFQDSEDQLFCPTVGADIAYGPANLGLTGPELEGRAREAMEMLQVLHLADRLIHQLSGGEKKRVALAGVLAMRPLALVLDEPTNGLDPASAADLLDTLRWLHQAHGHTLLIATHEIDRLPGLVSRVVILKNGEVLRAGSTREILTDIPTLDEAGLEAPSMVRYFYQKRALAGPGPIPLTVDEALEMD